MRSEVNEFMDTSQTGQLIRRSPGAVRNLVLRRKIPFRKPAGRLVFLRSEIETWMREAPGLTLDELRRQD